MPNFYGNPGERGDEWLVLYVYYAEAMTINVGLLLAFSSGIMQKCDMTYCQVTRKATGKPYQPGVNIRSTVLMVYTATQPYFVKQNADESRAS